MKRIFLLIEDFTELTFLETLLKKVGFDTLGSQSPSTALERALSLSPEVLIISDIIKSQSTHEVMANFKKYRPSIKIMILKRDLKYQTPHNTEIIDASIRSPVDPETFLKILAKVAMVEEQLIVKKFHKLGLFKGATQGGDERVYVQSTSVKDGESSENRFVQSLKVVEDKSKDEIRKKRFQMEIENLPEPKVMVINHKVAVKEMQGARNREADPEIQDIDEVRKGFVRALFKK